MFLWFAVNKAKNVLLLTVDGNNAPAGTGAVGSSEINTNDPMYIGGVPGLSLINANSCRGVYCYVTYINRAVQLQICSLVYVNKLFCFVYSWHFLYVIALSYLILTADFAVYFRFYQDRNFDWQELFWMYS